MSDAAYGGGAVGDGLPEWMALQRRNNQLILGVCDGFEEGFVRAEALAEGSVATERPSASPLAGRPGAVWLEPVAEADALGLAAAEACRRLAQVECFHFDAIDGAETECEEDQCDLDAEGFDVDFVGAEAAAGLGGGLGGPVPQGAGPQGTGTASASWPQPGINCGG